MVARRHVGKGRLCPTSKLAGTIAFQQLMFPEHVPYDFQYVLAGIKDTQRCPNNDCKVDKFVAPREQCNRFCLGRSRLNTTLCVTQTCHLKCYDCMCDSIYTVWFATCPLQMLWPYAWLCSSQLTCRTL